MKETNLTSQKISEQETFWSGAFGDEYIERNRSKQLVAGNISLFAEALRDSGNISSVLEFGANIGMNLRALRMLYPNASIRGVEINHQAAEILSGEIGRENTIESSLLDGADFGTADLVLVKGVLIHLPPDRLNEIYDLLFNSTERLILICEYYNPTPMTLSYRGNENKLFKRDFAGEILSKFSDLRLLKYGFRYRNDPVFPLDDITWFLLEKVQASR